MKTELILWGMPPQSYGVFVPLKITGGTKSHCLRESKGREAGGWTDLRIEPSPSVETRAKTEQYAAGKYDVRDKATSQRIGHIVGARDTWLAESGHVSLGYFATKKAAIAAIVRHRST
jgi:hypothetical protein